MCVCVCVCVCLLIYTPTPWRYIQPPQIYILCVCVYVSKEFHIRFIIFYNMCLF